MHLALDVVSEHLTVEPKENLLFDLPAEVAVEAELGPALFMLPLSEEEEEGEALAAAAAAIDDLRALLTLETRVAGGDEDTAPAVECLFVLLEE